MHDTGFIGLRLTQYRQILTKYDKAGLPNHLGQMVQTPEEIDRCMALTDPKLFYFRLTPRTYTWVDCCLSHKGSLRYRLRALQRTTTTCSPVTQELWRTTLEPVFSSTAAILQELSSILSGEGIDEGSQEDRCFRRAAL
jgi:hypothetical protein